MLPFLLFVACDGQDPVDAVTDPNADPIAEPSAPLVIYSGRGESLVGGLFERMESELGIDIEVRYGDTPELVTLMLTEGAESPADLIFAQDSGHLGALASQNMLAVLSDDLRGAVEPRFQDEQGRWVGTSGRARVLVYNTALPAEELPRSLRDLADPRWKGKLGWAPSNGSFQAHVSALRHIWGEDETRQWLEAVAANEPTVYPKNSPQVAAAAEGAIQIGWVNHYYLHRKWTEGYTAANYSFPEDGDAGNILMLAGMGIREGSDRTADASAVIGWMLSEETQTAFAQENYEYPTRAGIQTHPNVPPISALHLATVEQEWLADMGPTRLMLQELGLQ